MVCRSLPIPPMKPFRHFLTEQSPEEILGRNLAAKRHYQSLVQTKSPDEVQTFLDTFSARTQTYQTLLQTLKQAIADHLSHTSKLNITSGTNYAKAIANATEDIRKNFPKLTKAQIVKVLNNEKYSALDMADDLIDRLYPELRQF